MSERVSVDPKICHGQVCIKGTRIPVHQVIRMLANGDKIEELLEDYPSLKVEDIYAKVPEFKELGIKVEAVDLGAVTHEKSTPLDLCIDGKDRPGLVRHITQVLSDNSIKVENMECNRLGVPAIGGTLFTSHFKIIVDEQFNKNALVSSLQEIADDLIIDLSA